MAVATRQPRSAPEKRRKRGPASHRKKRGFFRRFWWLWVTLLLLPLVAAGIAAAVLFSMYQDIVVPDAPALAQTSHLYDRDGKHLMTVSTPVDRKVISLTDVSDTMQEAIIATEDEDFYEHDGVSPVAIARAAWADLRNQAVTQGGSTITQQYVKNMFLSNEVTLKRKIEEAMMAIKLESQTREACDGDVRCSKDEILEKYLNTIYFGHGAYGIQAASKAYFGIPASKLNIPQSATLAGLVAAPSSFDPIRHPKDSAERRDYALDRMLTEGYITPEQAEKGKSLPMKKLTRKAPEQTLTSFPGDYLAWEARQDLVDRFGEEQVLGGGLRVTTTLDPEMQELAQSAVDQLDPSQGEPDAAIVVIDPRNGEVRAMAQNGKGFARDQFNLGTQGKRQAGSSFKPFTLLAAMEAGYSLTGDTWYGPQVANINDEECRNPDGTAWRPANAADGEAGTFDLRLATAHSVNTVFAALTMAPGIGPEKVASVADRAGIQSPLDPVCSISLGTQLVSPLEMTSAYATLAAEGVYHEPTLIRSVRSPDGKLAWRKRSKTPFEENDVRLVTEALQSVVTEGTGTAASISAQAVAGKTGTAQDYKDAWFCGYTPRLASCVWVGYKKKPRPMVAVAPYGTIFGGTWPAAIWQQFMDGAFTELGWPTEDFVAPDYAGYDREPPGGSSGSPTSEETTAPTTDEPAEPTDEATEAPPPGGGGGGGGGGDPDPDPDPDPEPSP